MTSKSELESILESRVNNRLDHVDLVLHAGAGGRRGSLYSVRQDLPDGGQSVIGPHGYAAEMEYYIRGLEYGLRLAAGDYDEEGEP